jgi:hypothetical protein
MVAQFRGLFAYRFFALRVECSVGKVVARVTPSASDVAIHCRFDCVSLDTSVSRDSRLRPSERRSLDEELESESSEDTDDEFWGREGTSLNGLMPCGKSSRILGALSAIRRYSALLIRGFLLSYSSRAC